MIIIIIIGIRKSIGNDSELGTRSTHTSTSVTMQQSRLGLAQPGAATAKAGKARAPPKTAPKRTGPIWDTVEVVTNEMSNTPHVKCKQCDMKFSAGLTRVTEHITGMGCITCCPCEDDWFLTLKQKLVEESVDKHEKKKQKTTETEVDEMVDEPNPVKTEFKFSQQNIKSSMNASTAADVDAAIAEFCYGCNISANIISHPLFKKMYEKMRCSRRCTRRCARRRRPTSCRQGSA